jgi:hypothetical protein
LLQPDADVHGHSHIHETRIESCLIADVKTTFPRLVALAWLVFAAGCADESAPAKQDDRIGGRVGVVMPSQDMSRVAPTRPGLVPPAN